jgi:hypothetical protein
LLAGAFSILPALLFGHTFAIAVLRNWAKWVPAAVYAQAPVAEDSEQGLRGRTDGARDRPPSCECRRELDPGGWRFGDCPPGEAGEALQRLVLASPAQAAIVEGVLREEQAERNGGVLPPGVPVPGRRRLQDVLPDTGGHVLTRVLVEALQEVLPEWAGRARVFEGEE